MFLSLSDTSLPLLQNAKTSTSKKRTPVVIQHTQCEYISFGWSDFPLVRRDYLPVYEEETCIPFTPWNTLGEKDDDSFIESTYSCTFDSDSFATTTLFSSSSCENDLILFHVESFAAHVAIQPARCDYHSFCWTDFPLVQRDSVPLLQESSVDFSPLPTTVEAEQRRSEAMQRQFDKPSSPFEGSDGKVGFQLWLKSTGQVPVKVPQGVGLKRATHEARAA